MSIHTKSKLELIQLWLEREAKWDLGPTHCMVSFTPFLADVGADVDVDGGWRQGFIENSDVH